jgi:hypothetical protein
MLGVSRHSRCQNDAERIQAVTADVEILLVQKWTGLKARLTQFSESSPTMKEWRMKI